MLLESLIEQCERNLKQTYSVRVAHVHVSGRAPTRPGVAVVIAGWQWHVDIAVADGGVVYASATARGAAVRAAAVALASWLARFGGSVSRSR